jgi:hypothetical protein
LVLFGAIFALYHDRFKDFSAGSIMDDAKQESETRMTGEKAKDFGLFRKWERRACSNCHDSNTLAAKGEGDGDHSGHGSKVVYLADHPAAAASPGARGNSVKRLGTIGKLLIFPVHRAKNAKPKDRPDFHIRPAHEGR